MPVVHVVDDDASFLVALARLLKASGYTVQTYASAADFLAKLGDGAGCVVTDLRMPGMDGLDLQQALMRGANVLPVVFLTGEGDIPTTVQAMRQGAEDFLTKRAPKEDIFAAVNRAIARDARQRPSTLTCCVAGQIRYPHESRAGDLAARRRRAAQQADRGRPGHQRADGEASPHGHHHQASGALRGRTHTARASRRFV